MDRRRKVITSYIFNGSDLSILLAATKLLEKAAASPALSYAELVSIAKLQHVFSRLPKVTPGVSVELCVSGPRRQFGEIETGYSWTIQLEDSFLRVFGDGIFYRPSTGGDSFTTMEWSATPSETAEFSDYSNKLQMLPDLKSFSAGVKEIDFSSGNYKLTIVDEDNSLLDDSDGEDEDDEDKDDEEAEDYENYQTFMDEIAEAGLGLGKELIEEEESEDVDHPILPESAWDHAEVKLTSLFELASLHSENPQFAYGKTTCDFCGCNLLQKELMVDGRLKGELRWADMCAECFLSKGDGIGWGRGQIFKREFGEKWRMVAGGPPL